MYLKALVLILISVTACKSFNEKGNLEMVITANHEFSKNEHAAVADLKNLFKKTNVKAQTDSYKIFLEIEATPAKTNPEKVNIDSQSDHVVITGSSSNGLVLGIYSWMQRLGYRFYGPGEGWTFIPKSIPYSKLKWDTIIEPRFYLRYIPPLTFGTREYKQLKSVKTDWQKWYQRLRLGNPNHMPYGHYGSEFNVKYKEQIKTHPEWRAFVNGKRQLWSRNVKLCYTNEEVQQLYVQDAIKRLRKKKKVELSRPITSIWSPRITTIFVSVQYAKEHQKS